MESVSTLVFGCDISQTQPYFSGSFLIPAPALLHVAVALVTLQL